MKTLRNCIVVLCVFSGALGALLYLFQEKLTFFPTKLPEKMDNPKVPGLSAEWITFSSNDGTKLSGLFLTRAPDASPQASRWTVLYSHGNGGNLTHRFDHAVSLASHPVDVFIYDYRGFGQSEGSPTVKGVVKDGEAALKYLTEVKKIPPEKIILYGFSLGSAVTGEILKELGNTCPGVIIESGFSSVSAMAARRFPFIGPLALRENISTIDGLKSYDGPLLVIHSRKDSVISFAEGEIIFASSPSKKKTFFEMKEHGHNQDVWNDPAHISAMSKFFDGLENQENQ